MITLGTAAVLVVVYAFIIMAPEELVQVVVLGAWTAGLASVLAAVLIS